MRRISDEEIMAIHDQERGLLESERLVADTQLAADKTESLKEKREMKQKLEIILAGWLTIPFAEIAEWQYAWKKWLGEE